jgi:kynurenine formamidase
VTRGVLFDATQLPGKAPKGWLEPGTAVHREDLETLEKMEHVKVSEGDVILLYSGRWKHRAQVGPWKASEGGAGWHADVAYFLKDRGVSFIGSDTINDVSPTGFPPSMGLPIHLLSLAYLGVDIFDNLDFERAIETARRLNRYEFLFTAAPMRIEKGMGSPLNPLAIFSRKSDETESADSICSTGWPDQKIARAFTGNPVPPVTGTGAVVSRNSHLWRRAAVSASASRSWLSRMSIPIAVIASVCTGSPMPSTSEGVTSCASSEPRNDTPRAFSHGATDAW